MIIKKDRAFTLRNSKGFTLIELLVVVAIIGILSAVVLAALGTARNKAKASALKQVIRQVGTESELYFNQYNSYNNPDGSGDTVCNSLSKFRDVAETLINTGGTQPFAECSTSIDGQNYAVEVSLDPNTFWCTDSTGFVGETEQPPNGIRVCDDNSWTDQPLCPSGPATYQCDPI